VPRGSSSLISLLQDIVRYGADRRPDAKQAELLDALWTELRETGQREGLMPSPVVGALRSAAGAVTSARLPTPILRLLYDELVNPLRAVFGRAAARVLLEAIQEACLPTAPSLRLLAEGTCLYRQQDIPVLAACWYRMDLCGVTPPVTLRERLGWWREITEACAWWWPGSTVCVLSERPERIAWESGEDGGRRLHCDVGPAVQFRDGWGLYVLHGSVVPPRYVRTPETITARDILSAPRPEVRHYLLQRFGGMGRFLTEAVQPIQHDACGVLYRWPWREGGTSFCVVRVTNATPEPDGSVRTFWLRVPPEMRTAKAAVAWTFGLRESEYHPAVET
jgi:hypothetical protein